jgi:hypothetical protein
MWSRIVRAVVSIVISILPLLYFGGYLNLLHSFGLPYPSSFFGSTTTSSSPYGAFFGSGFPLLPVGATGITFLIAFTILSRVGSMGVSAMSGPRMPNMTQFQNMPFFQAMQQQQNAVPENLPADITKTQYIIMKRYSNGLKNAKDVAKSLSMDKKEVEKETDALKSHGYLAKNGKLTGKALELLS